MSNNVSIKYDDKSKNIVVHVNDKAITLLNQTENLKICNSSTFFTKSMVTKKNSQTDTVLPEKTLSIKPAETFHPEQQDYIDFFPVGGGANR